jgi:hypothetical protein
MVKKDLVRLFVDRSNSQWIVLDGEGNYWVLSTDDDNPWEQRQPFDRTEETDLEPVPAHYKYVLRLPF